MFSLSWLCVHAWFEKTSSNAPINGQNRFLICCSSVFVSPEDLTFFYLIKRYDLFGIQIRVQNAQRVKPPNVRSSLSSEQFVPYANESD